MEPDWAQATSPLLQKVMPTSCKRHLSNDKGYQTLDSESRTRGLFNKNPFSTTRPVSSLAQDAAEDLVSTRANFPKRFSIYRRNLGQGAYTLGPHRTITQYLVTMHSRFSPLPPVVLYSGPVQSNTPLVSVEGVSPNWRIKLHNPAHDRGVQEEPLVEDRCYAGPSFSTFRFCAEIGERGVRELFEWRNAGCWELVRLDGRLSDRKSSFGSAVSEVDSTTSAGSHDEEIVAKMLHVWDKAKQQAEFRFAGSGARGALGEKWETMAVASALLVFRQVRRHSLRPTYKGGRQSHEENRA